MSFTTSYRLVEIELKGRGKNKKASRFLTNERVEVIQFSPIDYDNQVHVTYRANSGLVSGRIISTELGKGNYNLILEERFQAFRESIGL